MTSSTDRHLATILRYFDGCSGGDITAMTRTMCPDVVHYFLAPNTGSTPVTGAEHLARYWRKVRGGTDARWVVDHCLSAGDQAVIEWTMFWLPPDATERVTTRGTEWYRFRDGLISEIRSYHQLVPRTSELDSFPYSARGYSRPGSESGITNPLSD